MLHVDLFYLGCGARRMPPYVYCYMTANVSQVVQVHRKQYYLTYICDIIVHEVHIHISQQ